MTAMTHTPTTTPAPNAARVVVPFVATNRLGPRDRDFGVGYGKSSGYASPRRCYTASAAPSYFRVA